MIKADFNSNTAIIFVLSFLTNIHSISISSCMNPDSIIGSHIFIVEDDKLMQFVYKRIFSRSCTLTVFDNGADAFSALEKGVIPDLIITDVNIPLLNGVELLAKVKSHEELSHIPVMMVSGDHSADLQCASLQAGASDYVVKPFDAPQLTERASKALHTAGTKLTLMHA